MVTFPPSWREWCSIKSMTRWCSVTLRGGHRPKSKTKSSVLNKKMFRIVAFATAPLACQVGGLYLGVLGGIFERSSENLPATW